MKYAGQILIWLPVEQQAVINALQRQFSLSQCELDQLVEPMWHIAFSDGELDKYEDYLIRKITELIHVSHGDFIRCKLKAAAQHQQ